MERPLDISAYRNPRSRTQGNLALQSDLLTSAPVLNSFFEGSIPNGNVSVFEKPAKQQSPKRETNKVINHHGFNMGDVAQKGEASEGKQKAREAQEKLKEDPNAALSPEELVRLNASFIQMRISVGGRTVNISNGLHGGVETIQPVMESLIGEKRGSERWTEFRNKDGVTDQMAAYIDIPVADFDLNATLKNFFRAPSTLYQEQGLTTQAEIQQQRENSIFSEKGKGKLAEDILSGRVNRLVQAFDPREDDFWGNSIYVWNSVKEGSEMISADMKGDGQKETELAVDERVSAAMSASILHRQKMSAETPEGMVRIYLSADAGTTIYCCDNATNAMLDGVSEGISQGLNISEIKHIGSAVGELIEQSASDSNLKFIGTGGSSEKNYCDSCGSYRNSKGKCGCNQTEQKAA